jgi:hypothetical protein
LICISPNLPVTLASLKDHLKLGLDNETALNIPDTLTYEEIGKPIDKGSKKVAYTLKNHPDLLFLQLSVVQVDF